MYPQSIPKTAQYHNKQLTKPYQFTQNFEESHPLGHVILLEVQYSILNCARTGGSIFLHQSGIICEENRTHVKLMINMMEEPTYSVECH
jgi:hypothetical protein